MNVNLSVPQLLEAHVVDDVRSALADSGLRPDRLVLEITESALLEDGPRAAATLLALRGLGVRLCIDDFGTGYSSLRYLHQFPIDALKIDRSFVAGRNGNVGSEPIVQMVVTLAQSLGLEVIAEGVESQMQREMLLRSGCRTGQGFYFSTPLTDPSEIERWAGARPVLVAEG
jgi:EAL domain-containing protein (putative c-di-GMP-specific phosphodiesterase class I)